VGPNCGGAPQQPCGWTLWFKGTGAARYAEVEDVDPDQTVSKLIARWLAAKKLDTDPSLVTLRHVDMATPGVLPSPEQEAQAVLLANPAAALRGAGLQTGAWLLVDISGGGGAGAPCCVRFPLLLWHCAGRPRAHCQQRACLADCRFVRPLAGLFTTLERVLSDVAGSVDGRGVLRRMRARFSSQVLLIEQSGNVQLARDVYEEARALPSTSTRGRIVADGYHLGHELFPGGNLMVCYKDCMPYLLKPLSPSEAVRVKTYEAAVSAAGVPQQPGIVPFELRWEDPAKFKCFMLMPLLHACLEPMPALADTHARRFWADISAALSYLHVLGFAHCDVKPANICVHAPTSFVLVDLGSVARFGEQTQSTPAYVPCDLRRGTSWVAAPPPCSSAALDWWMLGMVLAEKCCGNAALDIAGAGKSLSRQQLLQHLQAHLQPALLDAFRAVVEDLASGV
jgi:hypothetical protein